MRPAYSRGNMEPSPEYCGSDELLEEFRSAEAVYGEPTPSANLHEATVVATATAYKEGSSTGTIDLLDEFEHSFEDREETEGAKNFFSSSCCKLGPNKSPCYKHFSQESLLKARQESLELDHDEVDLVILSHLRAHRSAPSDKAEVIRQKVQYSFAGKKICRSTFLFIHAISHHRYEELIVHYDISGTCTRVHKNKGKSPHNVTSDSIIRHVKLFIENYATVHALPLPGRLPSHRDFRIMLLPSDITKAFVYRKFVDACASSKITAISRRTFENLWSELCPQISVMKPASDLCFVCQQNSYLIMKSVNLPEHVKSARLIDAQHHLELAKKQRDDYNSQCKKAAESFESSIADGKPPYYMHYSFDFTQQLHYPYNSQQPGELYFKTPRKCGLFGVACEARSYQVNYLIDECDVIGKGANTTISLVHHFLDNHGLKEQNLGLNADNCIGQNKNNAMVQYICWRVLTGKSKSVSLSFMLAGHTKFSPDRFFGLVKRQYRRAAANTLEDMGRIVRESFFAGKNIPQFTTDMLGQRHVHWYDWVSFLGQYFQSVPSITSYHHFTMNEENPGVLILKKHCDSEEEMFSILKKGASVDSASIPSEIKPAGLDAARQWYLYEQIRPFVQTNLAKDFTCPKPNVPKPSSLVRKRPASPTTSRKTHSKYLKK